MKYLEFTFRTSPCTETVNDVLAAILGDAGFESFVEQREARPRGGAKLRNNVPVRTAGCNSNWDVVSEF